MSTIIPVVQTLSYTELVTVTAVNLAVCALCFVVFGCARSLKRNRYFFAPLYYSVAEERFCPLHGEPSTVPSPNKPDVPPPGKGPFSWIWPTLSYRQDDLIATRGLDPIMHLRTLKLMIMILGIVAIPGLAVLVPVNVTASKSVHFPDGSTNSTYVRGVGELSMGNIRDKDMRMWAHAIAAWVFTLIVIIFSYREYSQYTLFRTRYNGEHKAHNYSIMVKDVPSFIKSSEQLEEYFKKFFGTKIIAAHMPLPSNDLRKLLKRKEKVLHHLNACEILAEKGGPLKKALYMRGGKFMFSKKQDAIIYYEDQLDQIEKQITEARKKLIQSEHPKIKIHHKRIGFVTFRSIGEAYLCAQSVLSADIKGGTPVPAPEIDDIYWAHLTRISVHSSQLVYFVSLLFFIVIILFWGTLTALLTGFANLESIDKVKWLSWLTDMLDWSQWLKSIVQKYLPFLIVVILQAFLPDLIYGILKLRGEKTRSRLEKSAMRIHFIFLVFNVFLVFTITTSTFSVWSDLWNLLRKSVPDLLAVLGQTLPSASTSFINYLLVYGLSSLPQQMLRLGAYVLSFFRVRVAVTDCDRWDANRPEYPLYGIWCANSLLIFLISLTYSVVAPVTVPFGVLVLFFEFLVAKYKYMYVTPQRFHSGASYWPMVYNRMIFALILSHCTLLGVFSLKSFYVGAAVTLPLPFLSLLAARHTIKKYKYRSRFLPISEFPPAFSEIEQGRVGREGKGLDLEEVQARFHDAYKDPALTS